MDTRRVSKLMLPLEQYATTSCSSTLRDALVARSKAQLGLTNDRHHHRVVLVLDEAGKVMGKVTHWSILKVLLPPGLKEKDQELLACHAITQMVEKHAQSVLVTRAGTVVGILRLSDVFEDVADAIRSQLC